MTRHFALPSALPTLATLIGILHASFSLAAVSVISTRAEIRPPDPGCQTRQTCDLQDVRFVEIKKRFSFANEPAKYASYMTDTRFAYTVTDPNQIEKYGVVQFIRGCMFDSYNIKGKVNKLLTINRTHFGEQKTFQHREWEVDSDSSDPIYTFYEGIGRFALLRWNQDGKSLNPETATWYANARPPHGAVFATDLPGSAALSPDSSPTDSHARNVSLEFKTCLFRLQDLPETTTPVGAGVALNKAVWCVNWNHRFVYDFKAKKMTTPSSIDPVCEVSATH